MDDNLGHANFSSGNQAAARPQRSAAPTFEQDQTLALLFDVTRELTSILVRDELLQRIADRVKKLVNYHLFMVMVWNESSSHLECAFAKHYEESITVQLSIAMFKGITGHAAGSRIPVRVDDVRLDQRYIEFPHSDNVRSELVIPLLLQDRLIGVLDLESTKAPTSAPSL
jgi:sigma-B regulation protein RsbU (phosphoserine phosphatase)